MKLTNIVLALSLASTGCLAGYMDPTPAPRAESDAGTRPPMTTPPPQLNCGTGVTNCGGTCRDLTNDRDNCGACGRVCATGQICLNSSCRMLETPVTCGSGLVNCNGSCRNVQLDDANCGACGTVCAMGQTCTAGRCAATSQPTPPAAPTCNGSCPMRSNSNATCVSNTCVYACYESYGDCDRNVATGCETALTTNANCGACGRVCGGGTNCQQGMCVTAPPPPARYLRGQFPGAYVCTWDLNADPVSAIFCSSSIGGQLRVNTAGSYWPGNHIRTGIALDDPRTTPGDRIRWIRNDAGLVGQSARSVGYTVLQFETESGSVTENLLDSAQSCIDPCHPSYPSWREAKVTIRTRYTASVCPVTCDAR